MNNIFQFNFSHAAIGNFSTLRQNLDSCWSFPFSVQKFRSWVLISGPFSHVVWSRCGPSLEFWTLLHCKHCCWTLKPILKWMDCIINASLLIIIIIPNLPCCHNLCTSHSLRVRGVPPPTPPSNQKMGLKAQEGGRAAGEGESVQFVNKCNFSQFWSNVYWHLNNANRAILWLCMEKNNMGWFWRWRRPYHRQTGDEVRRNLVSCKLN